MKIVKTYHFCLDRLRISVVANSVQEARAKVNDQLNNLDDDEFLQGWIPIISPSCLEGLHMRFHLSSFDFEEAELIDVEVAF